MDLPQIAREVQDLTGGETVVVALAEEDGQVMYYAVAIGKHSASIVGKRGATATSGLCGAVSAEGEPVLVCQTRGDTRIRQDIAQALGIETALGVPVYLEGKLLAVLMVLNRVDGKLFDDSDRTILMDYATTLQRNS
ncbi:MAG: hypothetical protein N5P05_004122 (plasmid) [Chroococcopsis gigantea SAG 12.99]|jgi:GAF domain-containing protein|nr:hypothetical protein [Chroococcopsis gigantea SAG 12.99]